MTETKQRKKRIDAIDALRGLAVVLMFFHHFFYDLVEFLDAPEWLFTNPVFNVLHYVFAGVFIGLCGVSSRFSRSNVKRGIITLIAATVISVVTHFMGMPILFGVLHLLAFCMLFYGITGRLWEKLPMWIMPVFTVLGTVISAWCVNNIETESENLWILGWTYDGFVSHDYFPLFPWIFVFLFGTWLGYYIKEHRFPEKFYTLSIPVLPQIGRQALIIYIVHQPILYGITMVIKNLIK
ncbi:MAG: DUF1624 domain-containing protein [Clostridia bacterium]|nr:DUF1624 domain-containing protein [Clostridia bacterium]